MNAGTLKQRIADVPDDAEVFFLPCPESKNYIRCCTVSTRNEELRTDDVDEDGNEIPAGSLLLFPA